MADFRPREAIQHPLKRIFLYLSHFISLQKHKNDLISVYLKIITRLRNRLTPSENHMLRLHSEAANRLHSRCCGSQNSTETHQALLGGDWWGKRAPERRGLLT